MDLSFLTIPATIFMLLISLTILFILFASLAYKRKNPEGKLIKLPRFSVIIPAHNEEKVIRDIIEDFLKQTYPYFEIIVVCHNCLDKTYEIASSIQDERLKVIELRTSQSGKALALNEALKNASGDIIVQMDADNRVNTNFLQKVLPYFADPNVQAIQVRLGTKNPNFNLLTKCQQIEYDLFGMPFWEGRAALGLSCTIGGTGVVIRRQILQEVNGWENELIEDFDLYCKLSQRGIKVIYAPDVECWDEKPPYWSALITQRARWLKGHIKIMRKRSSQRFHPLDIVYLLSPLFYLPWYLCALITALYFPLKSLGINLTFFFPPVELWLFSLVAMYLFFIYRALRQGNWRDIFYLPIFFIFSFHWLIAFLRSFTIKSWAETKTVHGYFQNKEGKAG
ncbi:glycosyltransferase family 2 protein [bacterium]|nr:glycosyltransferase family 2 protein [bacterium]